MDIRFDIIITVGRLKWLEDRNGGLLVVVKPQPASRVRQMSNMMPFHRSLALNSLAMAL